MIIVLQSVVTAIDDQTLMTYAMYENGHMDINSGIHLENCSEHWYSCLSEDDKMLVEHLLDVKKYKKKNNLS